MTPDLQGGGRATVRGGTGMRRQSDGDTVNTGQGGHSLFCSFTHWPKVFGHLRVGCFQNEAHGTTVNHQSAHKIALNDIAAIRQKHF
jgi:hypothetical protein